MTEKSTVIGGNKTCKDAFNGNALTTFLQSDQTHAQAECTHTHTQ